MKKQTRGLVVGFVLGLMVVGLLWLGLETFADVVYLKDGSVLEGEVSKEVEGYITIEGDGYWASIKQTDIEVIFSDWADLLKFRVEQLEKELEAEKAENEKLKKEAENLLQIAEKVERACELYVKLYNVNIRMRAAPGYRLLWTHENMIAELNELVFSYRKLNAIWGFIKVLQDIVK